MPRLIDADKLQESIYNSDLWSDKSAALYDAVKNTRTFDPITAMNDEQKKAYEWAINQGYLSVAACHARTLAEFIRDITLKAETEAISNDPNHR